MEFKTYEVEGVVGFFKFSPNGSPFEGQLVLMAEVGSYFDSIKLHKAGSRAKWAQGAAKTYPDALDATALERALHEIALLRHEEVEAAAEGGSDGPSEAAPPAPPEPGTERYEQAMRLLKNPRLLARAAVDMKRLGHVGEYHAKQLALVCAISAKAGTPIQPSTHAQSSAGKNKLWDTALSLLPEEMVIRRSGLTAKVLFRTQTPLKGAALYIQEISGSEDADYTIRVLQSDGRLEYEATEKMPDGSLKPVVHKTEGPTVVIQTTTKNHLHPENETRVLPLYIDESEEQTERIIRSIKRDAAGKGADSVERGAIRLLWNDAIRLLEPAEVVIPYAERIRIPSAPLRIRRDARRLIDVIRVVTWLHQHQRERDEEGRIVSTEADFHTALELVSDSLRRAWQSLTPTESAVLSAIKKLPEQLQTRGFKRRDLKVMNVSDPHVKRILASLTSSGYLDCDGRAGPQGYTYTLAREGGVESLGISIDPIAEQRGKSPANGRKNIGSLPDDPIGADDPIEAEGEEPVGSADHNGSTDNDLLKSANLQENPPTGSSDHGSEHPPSPHKARRRLTEEEAREVQKLMREGFSAEAARAEVLGEDLCDMDEKEEA